MEIVMNAELVAKLRKDRSWTQDHLAAAAGLSLRTIQRIEKDGVCSFESLRSLAAVLQVEASTLQMSPESTTALLGLRRGRFWGMTGVTVGALGGLAGVLLGAYNGELSGLKVGLYAAGIGIFAAANYVGIALFLEHCKKNKIGQW